MYIEQIILPKVDYPSLLGKQSFLKGLDFDVRLLLYPIPYHSLVESSIPSSHSFKN